MTNTWWQHRAIGVALALCAGCSFSGRLPDDVVVDAPQRAGAHDAPSDVSDEPIATNVLASGFLVSYTSEYCTPNDPPSGCVNGYWNRTNLTDGAHATGDNATAYRASWSSEYKTGAEPEEFVWSFGFGRPAAIDRVVIQNYGLGPGTGPFFTTRFTLYGEAPGATSWHLLLERALASDESIQTFDLIAITGAPVTVRRLRLSLTAGVDERYWQLGEVEAWGRIE